MAKRRNFTDQFEVKVALEALRGDFCVEALKEAMAKHGPPEIMNTDQGSQFTGSAWITTLTEVGGRISMGGRGRYLDNIFIEHRA